MSLSSAVLKPSLHVSSPAPLELVDAKGRSAASDDQPRAGTLRGRRVVVGVPSVLHQVALRGAVRCGTVVSSLWCGAGGYSLASALHASEPNDPQAYAPNLVNLLWGGASIVLGYALTRLSLKCWDASMACLDRRDLEQPEHNNVPYQLERLTENAIYDAPLSLAGMKVCIARIGELRRLRGDEVPAQEFALALAKLGKAVPLERSGCLPCGDTPLAQFNALVTRLAGLHDEHVISSAQFREALLSLAQQLREAHEPDERQVDAMAHRLLSAYRDATATDTKSSDDARLWDRADFIVQMSGTRHFAPHAQVVRIAGADLLGSHPRAYREAQPVTPQRARGDGKGQAEAGPVMQRLAHTPVQHLKDDVGRAIGLARNGKRPALEQAHTLLAILHTLACRTDLPPGAFLEGLLPPDAVTELARAVAADETPVPRGVDKAALIAELPRLCQLQASPSLMPSIVQALRQLPQHALEGLEGQARAARVTQLRDWIDAAFRAANARIAGTGQTASTIVGSQDWCRLMWSPATLLHHPWVDAARRQALDGIEPGQTTHDEPAPHVIQMRDFQNDPGADES